MAEQTKLKTGRVAVSSSLIETKRKPSRGMIEGEERRRRCRIVVFLQIKHTSVGVVETVHPTSHAVLYPDVSSQPGNNCLSSPATLHVHSLPLPHVFPAHLPFLFFFSSCCNYKLCRRIIIIFLQVRNSTPFITIIQWFHTCMTGHSLDTCARLFDLLLVSMLDFTVA
jgi:hypothetical protein